MKISVDTDARAAVFNYRWATVTIQLAADGTTIAVDDNVNGEQTGSNLTAATWYHIGYKRDYATAQELFLNGVSNISPVLHSCSSSDFDVGAMSDDAKPFNGCVSNFRMWTDATMGASDFTAEMNSATVVRSTNLYTDTPFSSDANDISGNGNHWTVAGTLSYESGPSFNIVNAVPSAASAAILIPGTGITFPGSVTVTVTL